ncbi:MAG: hypothetical protein GY769_12115 [bacterium]|nr:hypothetical protein [bacterium]
MGFVQTAGELLNFHPHVHVLVTDGGFLPDGTFRPLAWFDSQHVERLFRAEVLRMLLAKELITEAIVDNLLSWSHSGFSAHGAVRVEDRQGAVRLGRYMIRCPIVLKRLSWEADTGEVVCRSRPSGRAGSCPAEARWDVLEFLARVVDHIPEPSQQTVRYWGFYANAARGKRRKAAMAGDTTPTSGRQDNDEFTRRSRLSWAKLIRRVYEVDPLLCPFCGAEMKILAFILDFGSAKAIRKSLELPAQEPEPLAHAPPDTLGLVAESA